MQKMSDTTLIECPDCGTPGERQISAGIGVLFKGSGFYETDYKRKGNAAAKDAAGDSAKRESPGSKVPDSGNGKESAPAKPKAKDSPKTGEGS